MFRACRVRIDVDAHVYPVAAAIARQHRAAQYHLPLSRQKRPPDVARRRVVYGDEEAAAGAAAPATEAAGEEVRAAFVEEADVDDVVFRRP
ncbi:MAG: hypothetical protein IIB23_04530 [Chloroflexi bacterium]|nr:hypothetical protein [Chloroflexota bacterium]